METEVIDKLFLELSRVTKATTRKEADLLGAVKWAYRKHCLEDDNIGWSELSDILRNALCEAMTDEGFTKWLKENRP